MFCYAVDGVLMMRTASRLSTQPGSTTRKPDADAKPDEGHYPEQLRSGGWDGKARLADMDLDGMDLAFLYPTMAFFLAEVPDVELQTVLCRAYNDWLAEHAARIGAANDRKSMDRHACISMMSDWLSCKPMPRASPTGW